MSPESATPMTFGQLNVWLRTRQFPVYRASHANVHRIIPVDSGVTVADVRGALSMLRVRHEALHTTCELSRSTPPGLAVHPADSMELPVRCKPVGSIEHMVVMAEKIGDKLRRRPFRLAVEEPWRVAILTLKGRPVCLVIAIHHIAADLWALNLLEKDLKALLSGARLGAADSPGQLAMAQRSEQWQNWRRAAEQHQRTVLTAVARGGGLPVTPSRAAAVRATLRSSSGLAAAVAQAQELGISLASLLLAAYAYTAHKVMDRDVILVKTMFANRLYPGTTRLVSSMSQAALIASDRRPAERFDQFAHRIHWASLKAYRRACYDPCAAEEIQNDVTSTIGPVEPVLMFNFVSDPIGIASARPDAGEPNSSELSVVHQKPRRYGPAFLLIARQETDLSLTARVMLKGFDAAALDAFLATLYELLTGSCGSPAEKSKVAVLH